MVSVDPYRNETTRFADVILPPPSALERSEYHLAFFNMAVRNVAEWAPPLFDAPGPQEHEILGRLALIATGPEAGDDPAALDQLILEGALGGGHRRAGLPGRRPHGPRAGGDGHRRPDPIDARPPGRRHDPHRHLRRLVRRRARRHLPRHPGGLAPRARPRPARAPPAIGAAHALAAPSSSPRPPCSPTSTAWPPPSTRRPPTPRPSCSSAAASCAPTTRGCTTSNVLAKGRYRCTLLVHPDDAARLGLEHGADAEIRVAGRRGHRAGRGHRRHEPGRGVASPTGGATTAPAPRSAWPASGPA